MKTVFNINWQPLTATVVKAGEGGIYFLGVPFNVNFGRSVSRIFFIGSAANLQLRITNHAKSKIRGNSMLEQIAAKDLSVISCSVHPLRDLSESMRCALEAKAMEEFGKTHGYIPHANLKPPEFEIEDTWTEPVLIQEPSYRLESLDENEIAERYNLKVEMDPSDLRDLFCGASSINHEPQRAPIYGKSDGGEIHSINFTLKPKGSAKVKLAANTI